MLLEIGLFVIGLILLVKGSDFLVRSASSIAKKLGVSEFTIGLTLVTVGTSIPELASAIFASIKHESGLIIGNVVGANIANITLVLGIAAVIRIIKTRKQMLERDGYIMLFVVVLFFIFITNGNISRAESAIFLALYTAYVLFLFDKQRKYNSHNYSDFIRYFLKFQYIVTIKNRIFFNQNKELPSKQKRKVKELFKAALIKDLLIMVISGIAIILGARYFVNGAIFLAILLKVPETVIGLTFVSLGTTMPELSIAIAAAKRGFHNIIIGNAVGSVITNTLLILGVSGMINPLSILRLSIFYTAPVLMLLSVMLLFFIKSNWKISRKEGIVFLILYLVFISVIIYGATA